MNNKNTIAFFDLDHTLLPVDSSGLWAFYLIEHIANRQQEFKATQTKFDEEYEAGTLEIIKYMNFEMELLSSFPLNKLLSFREDYLKKFIVPKVMPKAVQLVKAHKNKGERTVLVTATYRFVVEPIAKLFGLDDIICAEPVRNLDGEFTGRWYRHAFEDGKTCAVRTYVERYGGEQALKGSSFYTDSITDLPLLQFIADNGGNAVAANPDDALEKVALERGWKIVHLFKTEIPEYSAVSEN
ncbi:MAG: haloacid dehalogenase-like hydrolase [Burkholderiales bacterium]|nr:haloacid dehalogenase-like hydrolase [Burkholderiales bacterium]